MKHTKVKSEIRRAVREHLKMLDCDVYWAKIILQNVPLSRACDFKLTDNELTILYSTNKKRVINLVDELYRICWVAVK